MDVAVTNYLGRDRELFPPSHLPTSVSFSLIFSSLFISSRPSRKRERERERERKEERKRVPSFLYGRLFFPFGLHFCGAKRNTYMDFVTGECSFRSCRCIPLHRGDHCFAPVRPNSGRGRTRASFLLAIQIGGNFLSTFLTSCIEKARSVAPLLGFCPSVHAERAETPSPLLKSRPRHIKDHARL